MLNGLLTSAESIFVLGTENILYYVILLIPETYFSRISDERNNFLRFWCVVTETKTKTVKETKWDWELLNDAKAVWLRNPKDVTAEEYDKFYHSLAKVRALFSIKCLLLQVYYQLRHARYLRSLLIKRRLHSNILDICCCFRISALINQCHGVISMLKEMLSLKQFSTFLPRLLMTCLKTTTRKRLSSSCMYDGCSSRMNSMSFCRSI